MKKTLYLAALGSLFLLAGCETTTAQGIANLVAEGKLSAEQGQSVLDLINSGDDWWKDALNVLGGAVLAWFGIRLPPGAIPGVSRGKATQAVGLPVDKIHPVVA